MFVWWKYICSQGHVQDHFKWHRENPGFTSMGVKEKHQPCDCHVMKAYTLFTGVLRETWEFLFCGYGDRFSGSAAVRRCVTSYWWLNYWILNIENEHHTKFTPGKLIILQTSTLVEMLLCSVNAQRLRFFSFFSWMLWQMFTLHYLYPGKKKKSVFIPFFYVFHFVHL